MIPEETHLNFYLRRQELTDNSQICPCLNCMIVPVCRHKPFMQMSHECELIKEFNPSYSYSNINSSVAKHVSSSRDRILIIENILKPTAWEYKLIPELDANRMLIVPKGYTIEEHEATKRSFHRHRDNPL